MNFKVIDNENDNDRIFEDKEDALKAQIDMQGLSDDVEIVETDEEPEVEETDETTNGHSGGQVQVVEQSQEEQGQEAESEESETLEPDVMPAEPEPEPDQLVRASVDAGDMPDPLVTVPDWMTTTVTHGKDESVDLNKRGTQVIANALDYNVDAECEIEAIETEFEYSRYRATVTTPDGETFTAVGDAHIKESGNNREDLERLAETRAKKRAVKWSAAGGLTPFMEDNNE